jgi:hypothetical protein
MNPCKHLFFQYQPPRTPHEIVAELARCGAADHGAAAGGDG